MPRTRASEARTFAPGQLCSDCSQLPLRAAFDASSIGQSFDIGNFVHARKNYSECDFCTFIIDTCELVEENFADVVARCEWTDVQFKLVLSAPQGTLPGEDKQPDAFEPWYECAGFEANKPAGPATWLHFSYKESNRPKELHTTICVSLSPGPELPSSLSSTDAVLPRNRSLAERPTRRVEYPLVKNWLRICSEEHSGLCQKSTYFQRRSLQLKLIDVDKREVVRNVYSSSPYLALSYVWGSTHNRQCQDFWSQQDQYDSKKIFLPDELPSTIEDAMRFTRELGYQYLWVDAYCINQDSISELDSQISQMHLVYECATLVLAAIDGQDCFAGLPGISKDIRKLSQPEVRTGHGILKATYIPDTWDTQGQAPWENRAWTLQEFLLSRRVVLFGEFQITMRCCNEIFSTLFEPPDSSPDRARYVQCNKHFWENGFNVRIHQKKWTFATYDCLLANYTRRTLSYPNDVISACRGALSQITRNTGVEFLHGLPRSCLPLALLWKPHHESLCERREGYPTWSWAGWTGRTEYHYCIAVLEDYEAAGLREKKKHDKKRARKDVVKVEHEAFIQISERDPKMLQVSSQAADVFLAKKRPDGAKMRGIRKDSEHPKTARGDQWVVLDHEKRPIENLVGEVARFERLDYSFRTNKDVSANIEQRECKCTLVFVKYFPFLRDTPWLEGDSRWLFDYVACLVLLPVVRHGTELVGEWERIGVVFMTTDEWASLEPSYELSGLV